MAGVQTRHLSGTLAVEAVMRNLNRFVRRSGSAIGGATGQSVPEPLTSEDIERATEVVRDPSFDIYVGKKDSIIRRVSARVEFVVPQESGEDLDGVESGTLTFSVEMSDVNGDQEIEAPASARPLSALTRSLGGGALDGLTGESGEQALRWRPLMPLRHRGSGRDCSVQAATPDAAGGDCPRPRPSALLRCLTGAAETPGSAKCSDLLHPDSLSGLTALFARRARGDLQRAPGAWPGPTPSVA